LNASDDLWLVHTGDVMTVGTYRFDQIFQEEVQAINVRRRELGRTDFVALEVEIDEAFAPR
jgi:hypothetical protein